jgi:hypothetical protein
MDQVAVLWRDEQHYRSSHDGQEDDNAEDRELHQRTFSSLSK